MRTLAFLLLFLSLAAFIGQKTTSTKAPEPNPNGQATDILFQSADGGKSWQDFSLGLPENLQVRCIFARNGEVYLGTDNGGVYHSYNPGMGIWKRESVSGSFPNENWTYPNEIITGIFPGPSGLYACVFERGFFRKKQGTNTWQPMHEALEDKIVHAVVEDSNGTIFIGTRTGIYKSEDDCKSWKPVLTNVWVSNLTEADGVLLYSGPQGLMRSADGGENWDCVIIDKGSFYKTSVMEGRFTALRTGGTWQSAAYAVPVRTSTDGGKTWQPMNTGLWPSQGIFNLEQAGKYLICNHKLGISRSTDEGISWELVRLPSDSDDMTFLNFAVSGQVVFAIKMRGGC